ncbi:Hypothetical protein CINCED_3A004679 [Cinara cedri]|uniref:Uncharacterized protein n=1 Tax=Cinara cedri TaxID=506608 RepID=A0A5E4M777_9HEMI|nr:Hypothetical protein CINCED_3A004679 [Cinara cedri]
MLRGLLYDGGNNTQAWGLIVLLVSKAAGHRDVESSADEKKSGVLRTQRALAEIAEMIRTSHLMHNGLLNPDGLQFAREPAVAHNDMAFGNKIALLSGDYLLANSYEELSALRNQRIMELIASALRDLAESAFVGRRDAQNNPLPSPFEPLDRPIGSVVMRHDPLQPSGPLGSMPLTPALDDWTKRNVLSAGSLLGKVCQGTLILGGHGEQLQKKGFLFGKHLSLAWQAYLDLEPFLIGSPYSLEIFNLTSAPVMFHLEHDPSLFEEIDKGVNSIHDVDYIKVHEIVMNGPGVEYTKQLQKEHSQKAMEVLTVFEESDARTALSNIIVAMDRE